MEKDLLSEDNVSIVIKDMDDFREYIDGISGAKVVIGDPEICSTVYYKKKYVDMYLNR